MFLFFVSMIHFHFYYSGLRQPKTWETSIRDGNFIGPRPHGKPKDILQFLWDMKASIQNKGNSTGLINFSYMIFKICFIENSRGLQ